MLDYIIVGGSPIHIDTYYPRYTAPYTESFGNRNIIGKTIKTGA